MQQRVASVVAAFALSAVAAGAQTERIVLPRGPAPDQTVHARMTQELTVNVEPDQVPAGNVPASSVIGAMTLSMTMAIGETLKFGPLDDRKQFEGVVTVDEVAAEMTMNGLAMPMPGCMPLKIGQQFTMRYDENRVMTDTSGDLPDATKELLKKMTGGIMRSMPTTPIAVGETVAIPMELPLPSMPTGPMGDLKGESDRRPSVDGKRDARSEDARHHQDDPADDRSMSVRVRTPVCGGGCVNV